LCDRVRHATRCGQNYEHDHRLAERVHAQRTCVTTSTSAGSLSRVVRRSPVQIEIGLA
jgi:hypothetical protein